MKRLGEKGKMRKGEKVKERKREKVKGRKEEKEARKGKLNIVQKNILSLNKEKRNKLFALLKH